MRRPRSLCRHPCCGARIDAPGYCPKHSKPSGWVWRTQETAQERGYGWAWKKLRDHVMHRDAGLCQPCIKRGTLTAAREVDHIVAKALGGTDEESNLQAICSDCHKQKTVDDRKKCA